MLANFSLSNVDANFRKYSYLMFPSKAVHTDGIRAGVMVRFVLICSRSSTNITG